MSQHTRHGPRHVTHHCPHKRRELKSSSHGRRRTGEGRLGVELQRRTAYNKTQLYLATHQHEDTAVVPAASVQGPKRFSSAAGMLSQDGPAPASGDVAVARVPDDKRAP